MKKFLVAVALVAAFATKALAVCTAVGSNPVILIPNFGDAGNVWAACLRYDFTVWQASSNFSGSVNTWTSSQTFKASVGVATVSGMFSVGGSTIAGVTAAFRNNPGHDLDIGGYTDGSRVRFVNGGAIAYDPGYIEASKLILNGASGGSVGVNTLSPSTKFNVDGTAAAPSLTTSASIFSVSAGNHGSSMNFGMDTASPFSGWIQTDGGYPILLNPVQGKVGINTTNPGSNFEIWSASSGGTKTFSTDAYTAWTPAYTGFSVNPVNVLNYKRVGKTVTINMFVTSHGTSNAAGTSWTMTAPFVSARAQYGIGTGIYCLDNGTALTSPGQAYIGSGDNLIYFYKYDFSTAWTNSGTKNCVGTITYEAQ